MQKDLDEEAFVQTRREAFYCDCIRCTSCGNDSIPRVGSVIDDQIIKLANTIPVTKHINDIPCCEVRDDITARP